ncbi:hypothetical protein GFD17_06045 [Bifidobacterium sp. SMB2]|uniref:Teichoic acid transporter n=1 Tax=Bifidobacterium saimiriisciurei TaxID=2661627 RepID=A0ABX0C7A4_9BIFI|nr:MULTISPECIES: hypothetical protein [Bifidobacterium]NEG96317.1 hypothetical protein [Bifidobacterium sp. SMB2]NEH11051.1 hypothetical protein [Bifidobacterium saimiriisciurei]
MATESSKTSRDMDGMPAGVGTQYDADMKAVDMKGAEAKDAGAKARVTDPSESHPREPSIAELGRRRWHKGRWAAFIIALIAAIIVPYGGGRLLAMNGTQLVVDFVEPFDPRGMALLSWAITVVMFASLGMAVMETKRVLWRVLFILALALEQLVAGVGLLRLNFWNSTYVVYGEAAPPINAANLGIISAAVGLAVFAVVYVGLLVTIHKDSRLNTLTRSWSALSMFFVIEVVALLVVLLGGLVTAV